LSVELLTSWILLAQEAAPEADQAPGGPNFLLPLIAIFFLFYFLILRPQKNKEQAMRTMVDNLKEKDRVVTVGGIYGVVTNVQRDQQMVTLRVDESTGAKIRVGVSAIARVVVDDDKSE
jgi:preprotein translocase subunit YajC